MVTVNSKDTCLFKSQCGFTLIELMIVIVIIGILSAVIIPNYQQYVIKSKRTDMMSELQNIASQIQSRKLAQGTYSAVTTADLIGTYPKQGTTLYNIAIAPAVLTSEWTITATPEPSGQMANDGNLSINYQGVKCRASKCGIGETWKE